MYTESFKKTEVVSQNLSYNVYIFLIKPIVIVTISPLHVTLFLSLERLARLTTEKHKKLNEETCFKSNK